MSIYFILLLKQHSQWEPSYLVSANKTINTEKRNIWSDFVGIVTIVSDLWFCMNHCVICLSGMYCITAIKSISSENCAILSLFLVLALHVILNGYLMDFIQWKEVWAIFIKYAYWNIQTGKLKWWKQPMQKATGFVSQTVVIC